MLRRNKTVNPHWPFWQEGHVRSRWDAGPFLPSPAEETGGHGGQQCYDAAKRGEIHIFLIVSLYLKPTIPGNKIIWRISTILLVKSPHNPPVWYGLTLHSVWVSGFWVNSQGPENPQEWAHREICWNLTTFLGYCHSFWTSLLSLNNILYPSVRLRD